MIDFTFFLQEEDVDENDTITRSRRWFFSMCKTLHFRIACYKKFGYRYAKNIYRNTIVQVVVVTDLFKKKAETYDSKDWDKELSAIGKMILSEIPFHDEMHVMDFGAGTGLLCSQVAPMVQKITAVDISEAMLEKLNAKPELKTKVNAVCQDIMNTSIDGEFDMIISAFAMHHVEDTHKLIQTFAEHLGAGSRIALVDIDEEDGSFHSEDNLGVFHCGFDRDNLKSILKMHSFDHIDFVQTHFFKWDEKEYSAFLVTALKV